MSFSMQELRNKFSSQRSDAKRRGVVFSLTFDDWLAIWKASKRLPQRGQGAGYYVMARNNDRGGYELGNVHITLFENNAQQYRPTLDAKTRTGLAHRGKIVSRETRMKLSQKAGKRTHSPATRMRMSATHKRVVLQRTRNERGQFV